MFLVKRHVRLRLDFLFQRRFFVQQLFHAFFLDEMRLHDFFGIFRLHLHVEDVIRENLNNRPFFAEPEAAGNGDLHAVRQLLVGDRLFEIGDEFLAFRRLTARAAADKHHRLLLPGGLHVHARIKQRLDVIVCSQ